MTAAAENDPDSKVICMATGHDVRPTSLHCSEVMLPSAKPRRYSR